MEEGIRQYLGDVSVIGREIRHFDIIDSTNDYLKKTAQMGAADGLVVIADCQTAGRGRIGRTFQSVEGKGIYMSVLLYPQLPPERLLPIAALAGLAVCDAVERVYGIRPKLKWPNDVMLEGRKLGGILTELVTTDGNAAVILGIGLNVSQDISDFSPEVAEMAASLAMVSGKVRDRAVVAAALVEETDRLYAALRTGDLARYLEAYRRDCITLGKTVQLVTDHSWETAVALDVDENFGLLIQTADGTQRIIRSGEVSVRGLYGYAES